MVLNLVWRRVFVWSQVLVADLAGSWAHLLIQGFPIEATRWS